MFCELKKNKKYGDSERFVFKKYPERKHDVFDNADGNTDFEWTDNDHTSFTITMQDAQNDYYWKKPILVAFDLENEGFTYANTVEFLEG